MADVTAGAGASGAGARDRAQLLLVAGLVMAVTLVVLALTLNTVIYTENLATRSSDIAGGDDSVRFLDATEGGVAGVLDHANRNHNGSHAAVRANVSADIETWRNLTGRSYAVNGVATNLSGVTITNGSRLHQANGSRTFTDANGNSTWTLASGVSGTRQFRLNVTNDSLATATHATVDATSSVFYVEFNDQSSSRWRLFVYRNLTTRTVNVTAVDGLLGTRRGPCSARDDQVFVNVTAGTVGGEPCSALSFVSDLQAPYTVTYNDTELTLGNPTVNGTYHLIVDDESVARSPGPAFNDAPGNSPWADAAVYAVSYDAIYETARLRYNASVRVAPDESDG